MTSRLRCGVFWDGRDYVPLEALESVELRVFLRGATNVIPLDEDARVPVAETMGETAETLCGQSGGEDSVFPILGPEVTFYGERWGEKWVEHVGDHLFLYAGGGKRLLTPGSARARAGSWRKHKSLSGDVSGAIGETLFALLLRREFQQPLRSFAHLRALKAQSFPDFEIIAPSPRLLSVMGAASGRMPSPHFPAEVKTISVPDANTIADRAYKALTQVSGYWSERARKDGTPTRDPSGIIALLIRNTERESYDAILYMVT